MTVAQKKLKEQFLEPEVRDGVEVSRELKAAWKIMLDILEEFIRICEKYDLRYCLDGGSVIGAIRHKGFIPWDDDVDVSLPRKDFRKFLRVAKLELKAPYFLQYGTTDPEHFQAFACIRNNGTSAIDTSWIKCGKRHSMGIGMDIFPFDYVPRDAKNLKWILWRNKLFVQFFVYVFSRGARNFRQKVAHLISSLIYRILGKSLIVWLRDRNFASCNANKASRYGNLAFLVGNERGLFRKEVFATRVKVPFEYIDAYVPGCYEEYLSQVYGKNWRTPIRGAGSHDPLVIDAKRPYKELLIERFGYKHDWVEKLP